MKKIVLAATLASLLGAPAAEAASNSAYLGGCFLQTATASGESFAQLVLATVLYSTTATDNPVSATVTCQFKRNGVLLESVSASDTGVVYGNVGYLFYPGSPDDEYEICTIVDYTSDTTPTQSECRSEVYDEVAESTAVLDSTLCPVLGALAPGVPGVVDVEPGGDVDVLGGPFWDCPPYGS